MISTARRRAGLSLAKLAERAGTSPATLHAYERGRVAPRLDTLERVLGAAGMRVDLRMRVGFDEAQRAREIEHLMEFIDQLPRRKRDVFSAPKFPERLR